MKEYSIYCRYSGATPYILGKIYNSKEDVIRRIYEIVASEEDRGYLYYVDNDFFENKYPLLIKNQMYLCVREREVSSWKKISNSHEDKENKNTKDNIFYLK